MAYLPESVPTAKPPAPPQHPQVTAQGGTGRRRARRAKHDNHNSWLDSLPQEDFYPEELRLREGIFDFLAAWPRPELATVYDLEADPMVRGLCAELFPPGVFLIQWMEHRIGGETLITPDGAVHLRGGAGEIVAEKHMALNRTHHRSHMPAPGDFFWGASTVPDDSRYEPAVKTLREALERARYKDPEAFEREMTFNELKKLMTSIGERFNVGEIASLGDGGPAAVVRRYCADLVKLKTAKQEKKQERKQERKREKRRMADDDHCANEDAYGEFADEGDTSEDFLSKLASHDILTRKELPLRKALLTWMRKQQEDDSSEPVLFDAALEDHDVIREANTLLSKANVSLLDWIERRLGDDVGVGLDENDHCLLLPLLPLDELMQDELMQDEKMFQQGNSARSKKESDKSVPQILSRLPPELTYAEQALAERLTQFDGIPLSHAQNKVNIQKKALLEEALGASAANAKFPFKTWIELRIADYISLVPDSTGQPLIRAVGKYKRTQDDANDLLPKSSKRAKRAMRESEAADSLDAP